MRRRGPDRAGLTAAEIIRRDGLATVLSTVAAQALHQLADARTIPPFGSAHNSDAAAVPRSRVREIDAETVAAWFVDQLPRQPCAAVVIGSPHGAAVHLALAIGAPWLPAAFDTTVECAVASPDRPAAALLAGEGAVADVLDANDAVAVRQSHDPTGRRCDGGIRLTVRWRQLPRAYRRYLDEQLVPGGSVIVVRDVGRWPVLRCGDRFTFQLGSRAGGIPLAGRGELPDFHDGDGEHSVEGRFVDDLRWWVQDSSRQLRQVLYRRPEMLSAGVADLYRCWQRHAGRAGNRLVVECGRLVAPWQVLRGGLVPYWCDHPLAPSVSALEWWLAGSEQYSSIEVLPEPPGLALPGMAELAQWGAVAAFAARRGLVDARCAGSYPHGTVAPRYAGSVVGRRPYDLPLVATLTPDAALSALATSADTSGILVL